MKIITRFALLICCGFLSACGFHAQSREDFPKGMRTLYFNAQNPDGALATEVRRRLTAAKIKLINAPGKNTVELLLEKAAYKTSQPIVFYSGNAVKFNYTLSATYQLRENGKPISARQTVSISRSLLHNANQAYTSGSDVLMQRELTQAVATEIIFQLTTHATHSLIQKAVNIPGAGQRPAVL